MDLIEVDVIGAEALEARLERLDDVEARQPDLVGALPRPPAHFRRQHDVGTPRSERLAEHRLRLAGGVDVRRVDEVDPRVERAVDDLVDGRLIGAADGLPDLRAAAERHRAEAQLRHEHAGIRQLSIFHGI
jgi:hypothetical protein